MALVEVTLHSDGSESDDKRMSFNPEYVLWIQPAQMYDGVPIIGKDTPKAGTRIVFEGNQDARVQEDYNEVLNRIEAAQ